MDQKKYQIFISSTYKDLIEAREKVMKAILSLYHFPVGMEMFSAGDDDQWTIIQADIDSSDYYVLLLGHRYGSVTDEGISYTEKEYDYAREKGIPVLAFVMDREAATKPSERESDPEKQAKLEAFVEKAQGSKMCSFWKTPDDLVSKVSIALTKAFRTHPRLGWVRADQAVSPKMTEELVDLIRENRELKAELETLKKAAERKNPSIEIGLNGGEPIELNFHKNVSYHPLRIPKVIEDTIPEHLREYVDEDSIKKFNSSVPENAEKALEHNKKLKRHKQIELMGVETEIFISNAGESKGTNIYIDLEFPEAIQVLSGTKEDFPLPSRPSLPVNPLEKAEERYNQLKYQPALAAYDMYNSNLGFLRSVGGLSESGPRLSNIHSFMRTPDRDENFYSWRKDNTITIYCSDLLHTRERKCRENYILLPKKPGNYEIKVSVICAEYAKREEFFIPVIIHENE